MLLFLLLKSKAQFNDNFIIAAKLLTKRECALNTPRYRL
ncbi:hypothetical protein PTUN_a2374 [Pseudoalteromonas tunicata]|nr:hypothetical protein PTUN_a2374 [Pseudoalteromonas tunicata]